MDFDDSGIDSDPKVDVGSDFPFVEKNEPIISFSPDRSRFDLPSALSGSTKENNILSLVSSSPTKGNEGVEMMKGPSSVSGESRDKRITSPTSSGSSSGKSNPAETQRLRLEKKIARANSNNATVNMSPWSSASAEFQGGLPPSKDNLEGSATATTIASSSTHATTAFVTNGKHNPAQNPAAAPACSSSASNYESSRKPSTLLPPQRLAIPNKSHHHHHHHHHSNTVSANEGSSSENKPLVQWDSDESEEEVSFFPAPKSRGVLNDNLSIDNMSLSGEEDDLHLSPPRPISHRCPCDPRQMLDHSNKQCFIM